MAQATFKCTVDAVTRTLTWKNGEEALILHVGNVAAETAAYATLHGFKQRIDDARALSRDEVTGKSATPAEKFAAMRDLVEWYEAGNGWARVRGPATPRADYDPDHLGALVAVRGGDRETVLTWARGRAEAKGIPVKVYLAGMLQVPEVRAAYDNILAGRAMDLDAEAMEEELMA